MIGVCCSSACVPVAVLGGAWLVVLEGESRCKYRLSASLVLVIVKLSCAARSACVLEAAMCPTLVSVSLCLARRNAMGVLWHELPDAVFVKS